LLDQRKMVWKPAFVLFWVALIVGGPFQALAAPMRGDAVQEDKKETPLADPDASPPLPVRLTPWMTLGAKLRWELLRRENRDLQGTIEDDRTESEPALKIAGLITPRTNVELFAQAALTDRTRYRDGGETTRNTTVEIERAYLLWRSALGAPLDVQLGRQRFHDPREWLFDENLDAVRLLFDYGAWGADLSVSSTPSTDDRADRMRNGMASISYQRRPHERAALYALLRRDISLNDWDPTWLGVSLHRRTGTHQYWLEAAALSGRDGARTLRSHGVDLGYRLRLPSTFKPSFMVGYARGSGDENPADTIDQVFQQTGLQDNEAKLNGITTIKYYGEVFDPELSNLEVWTAGAGVTILKGWRLEGVWHRYDEVVADDRLRDAGIRRRPSGNERSLGGEVDLVLGIQAIPHARIEVTGGVFAPGRAFPGADAAYLGKIEFQFVL